MPLKLGFQGFEGRRDALQPMHGAVGGIAARIILGGPAPPGRIVVAQLPAFLEQLAVELLRAACLQGVRVHERWK